MRHASLSLLLLFGAPAFAGTNADVVRGVIAYQQQDYELAIKELDEGLEDPSIIKPKNVPKGWYYLGMAHLGVAGSQQSSPATGIKHAGAAAEAFQQALNTDDGKWHDSVVAQHAPLGMVLIQFGSAGILSSYALQGTAKTDTLSDVHKLVNHAIMLQPYNHLAHDLLGQALQGQQQNAAATAAYLKALDVAEQHPPSRADIYVGYVAVRAATLQRFPGVGTSERVDGDPEAALVTVQRGKKLLDREWARSQNRESTASQHAEVVTALRSLELDLLLNLPTRRAEAIRNFEQAVQADPSAYLPTVALAQLLQSDNAERAETLYKQAIAVDPSNPIAQFNLAAMYVNQSATLGKLANDNEDFKAAQVQHASAVALQAKARPHLEAAFASDPTNRAIVSALIQVCLLTEDMAGYTRYKAKMATLK